MKWRGVVYWGTPLLALLVLLAALAFLLEYRTQFATRRLGQYLLAHNAQRPRQGAIWQAIQGSQASRALLSPISDDEIELGNIPPELLRCTYEIETRSSSLVLRTRPRAAAMQPGRASREEMQALARSLNAYSVGEDLLNGAILSRLLYQQQARTRLAALLSDGGIFPALDHELRTQEIPDSWRFAEMSVPRRSYWQMRLRRWYEGALDGEPAGLSSAPADTQVVVDEVAGSPEPAAEPSSDLYADLYYSSSKPREASREKALDRAVEREYLYQRTCVNLIDSWTDSLYTRGFLRLTGAWSDGVEFRAPVLFDGSGLTGKAFLENRYSVKFTIPLETAVAALGPGALDTGEE